MHVSTGKWSTNLISLQQCPVQSTDVTTSISLAVMVVMALAYACGIGQWHELEDGRTGAEINSSRLIDY